MKVIDLLNKIANGEEVPKKIMFLCDVYELSMINEFTYYKNGTTPLLVSMNDLNYEVEIIEEDKNIEKLYGEPKHIFTENELYLAAKINEKIDYLEENK